MLLDGKLGFVNQQGEQTVPPTYLQTTVKVAANLFLGTSPDDTATLLAADEVVTPLPYKDAQLLYNGADGRLVQVKNDEGQIGVVDWHGNLVIPFGPYSEYGNRTSTRGDLLLMDNQDTRMIEVYTVK